MSDPTAPRADASGLASIITHRLTPSGVLPRRGQVWLMVGVAGGILAIILFTGNHDPAPPRTSAASSPAALAPNPEQLRTYQRRLEAADTRPQAPPISLQDLRPSPRPADDGGLRDQGSTRAQDPIAEERRRREYESLFANSVVQSPTLATTEPTRSPSPQYTWHERRPRCRATVPGRRGGGGCTRLDDAHEYNLSLNDSCADDLRALARAGATTRVHRGRRSTASHYRRPH